MKLVLPAELRRSLGLSAQDVINAGLAAQCRRVGKPLGDIMPIFK